MRASALVEAFGAGLATVQLEHLRQRSDGVLGLLERDGAWISLCAHRCGLTSVPAAIATLAALERLDVGGNQLVELPALPPRLRELYIYDNLLVRLPELPGGPGGPSGPGLRVLDANRNRLVEVPPLLDVEFVYVAANRLTAVPWTRGVRYLNVSDNPLTSFELADPALAELRAEQCGLRELPPSIAALTGLRELSLRGNVLGALPAALGALTALQHLDLRGNLLETLPEELAALPALRKLDLRWNPLRRPPAWLGELAARGCAVYT